jgi:hypothetical protein
LKEAFSYHSKKSLLPLNDFDNEHHLGDGRRRDQRLFRERMGGIVYAERESWNADAAVAVLWTASGFGLFWE